jgi:hypothetical protein
VNIACHICKLGDITIHQYVVNNIKKKKKKKKKKVNNMLILMKTFSFKKIKNYGINLMEGVRPK